MQRLAQQYGEASARAVEQEERCKWLVMGCQRENMAYRHGVTSIMPCG